MKERAISVTEASRNFAECINRVRYQGLSFLLVKNGTAVARLVPATGAAHTLLEGKAEQEEQPALPAQRLTPELPEGRATESRDAGERKEQPDGSAGKSTSSLQW